MFFTGGYVDLSSGQVYDILYVTPNTSNYAHMIFEISTEAEATFALYEGVTTSANGTAITTFCRNRQKDNQASVLFYHTPTVTGVGTLIGDGIFGSGKTAGGMTGGVITFQIMATDGTDFQVHAGHANFAAVNKGGVYYSQITDEPTTEDANADSTGVLTDTWAITSGTNKVTISVSVACSLITANSVKIYYTVHLGGTNALTQL